MSSTTTSQTEAVATKRGGFVKLSGIIIAVIGAIMFVGGASTWVLVQNQLSAENIVVAEDASFLAGDNVNGPFSAYAQAQIINHHALTASQGKTYAELGAMITEARNAGDNATVEKLTATRTTLMNASFLRASLFTSVVAYGVALLVIGLGIMFALLGWAFMSLAPAKATDARAQASADEAAAA